MSKSTASRPSGKAAVEKPPKPYADFPLTPHPAGYWCKSIKGRLHYFGRWGRRIDGKLVRIEEDGWKAALDLYQEQKDDLYAGRTPRQKDADYTTIKDLCNAFLTHCTQKVEAGELSERSLSDYKDTCDRLIKVLGKNANVEELQPDDFARLRRDIGKRVKGTKAAGVHTVSGRITRCRVAFNFAFKNNLISKRVKYGVSFDKPSATSMRQARAEKGSRMLQPEQCRQLIDAAGPELRAMILLALNCGFGNADCAKLRFEKVDLDAGWIDWPRPKTGIPRKAKLWPETVDAVRVVRGRRAQNRKLVFVTERGNSFDRDQSAVSKQFRKLLDEQGLYRPGINFYALRHTFRTVAGGCRDLEAVRLAMGHAESGIDGHYIEVDGFDPARLDTVADHVRDWLYGNPEDEEHGDLAAERSDSAAQGEHPADNAGQPTHASDAARRRDNGRPRLRIVG